MNTESENVRLARRFVEGVLGGADPGAFNEIVDDNVWVSTGLKPDAPITSKAEYGAVLGSTLGAALSDGVMKIEDIVETADGRVLVRFLATGKRIEMAEIHLLRFKDGKLVENYVGALNPLSYEMLFREHIASLILK
jgi:ketosteroid isomerase-like protein